MKHASLTGSQQSALGRLRLYLTEEPVVHSPTILAGESGTGKTHLAKLLAQEHDGYYTNIAVDHLDALVRYHSFARITPEEVARLIIQLCKAQPQRPLFADGLEPILGAIAFNNRSRPDILSNFFTALKRTRDLPVPVIVVLQISELVPADLLKSTGWWSDPHFCLLELKVQDKRIIAENLQVMPVTAEKASSATAIVLSKVLRST